LARVALLFGPPEYTTMILMALVTIVVLSSTSLVLTLGTAVLGLLLGTVGTDLNTGIIRFSFGSNGLVDGVSFVSLAVGVFAFAEVMAHIAAETHRPAERPKISSLIPTRQDLARSWGAALRGTAIGGVLGLMPGTGPLISSFASYVVEKQIAKDPTRFGNGAVEGVAGPEAANNAAALTHFIPMLTLGIPAGSAMALMLGALIIQGITPGPQVMTEHPDLFWGLVVSMWLGNTMLLVLNLPLVGVWVRLLAIPYRLLYPGILMFCCIGVYSLNNSTFDVFLATGFGVLGFGLKKLGCAPAPLLLGLILGPLLEENFRRALLLSRGELTVFIQHPISLGFLIVTALLPFVFLFTSRQALARRSHQAG
jgi:TctA family transporter